MALKSKFKKVKKVTEIPNATVTIEVEEKEDPKAEESEKVEEVKEELDSAEEKVEEAEGTSEEAAKSISEIQEQTKEALGDLSGDDGISWKKIFLIALIVVPVGIGIFVGLWVVSEKYQVTEKKGPVPTSAIEMSPTPTEEAEEVDKTEYEIEVLNGSGIAGEAANVQELLEKDGFVVSSIGNSSAVGVTKTILGAKEDVSKDFIDELQKALEERGPVEVEEIDEDETSDVIVTVGSETSE